MSTFKTLAIITSEEENIVHLRNTTTTMGSGAMAFETDSLLPPKEPPESVLRDRHGSTATGAIFNFTNSILGAGAIALAGAIADSGGLASVMAIIVIAILSKQSFDMVIELSVETEGAQGSYEELGAVAYGRRGRLVVLFSKLVYCFGSLVAYIVIVKDNFASATQHLLYGGDLMMSERTSGALGDFLSNHDLVVLSLSATVIFPLCLLRDMAPLEKASIIKIASVVWIVGIVSYLLVFNPNGDVRKPSGSTYENWFQVRSGFLRNVGTFVFTFVAQHTVHLAYASIREDLRTLETWRKVSTGSILLSTLLSMAIGFVVYITFWQATTSAIFEQYPPLRAVDFAKILLSIMIMLTYPMAFFSCREMVIIAINHRFSHSSSGLPTIKEGHRRPWWLMAGEEHQLLGPLHVALTTLLWGLTTLLAIKAPSLGDVLNLVGCATGTVIAYILPALFYFKLRGYSHLALLIFAIGGAVGLVGTFYSLQELVS